MTYTIILEGPALKVVPVETLEVGDMFVEPTSVGGNTPVFYLVVGSLNPANDVPVMFVAYGATQWVPSSFAAGTEVISLTDVKLSASLLAK